ncbi:hypothetical protein M569_01059, partial [Genlisea aurea]
VLLVLYLGLASQISTGDPSSSFSLAGFRSENLTVDGIAGITPAGVLRLTDESKRETGHAFFPTPFRFMNSSNSSVYSFSTHFVFAIVPKYNIVAGQGMAFVMAPQRGLPGALARGYLGLFNETDNGNSSNHVFAVEIDTVQNLEFNDMDDNHLGININSLISVAAKSAGYQDNQTGGEFKRLNLTSGLPMQLWIDYSGGEIDVFLAPLQSGKPTVSLVSLKYDLSTVLNENMYVGFSASNFYTAHFVLGWSFAVNGAAAPPLDLALLPKIPRLGPVKPSKFLTTYLPVICAVTLLLVVLGLAYSINQRVKYSEVIEGWELDYISHRFKYRDLYKATKGFKDRGLLGTGGFGKVYRGVMPGTKVEVAVKRVSHDSRQGTREFVAEIVSIGRLRHRNLVALLGYCRRKSELLLVYEYMPNGSLDKFLHGQPKFTLNWAQRFRVIKGVGSGLLYLHEEWEQVVIHRDIKASNVLLDGELNARLGDFGLARLYDHGSDPQTTHIVGTLGYLAPEHTVTGKASTRTDVYGFGAFLLEVVCGKRPIDPKASAETAVLVEWVISLWSKGELLGAVDPILEGDYHEGEAELVLKLGLLCCQSRPEARPTTRNLVMYLEGSLALPEIASARELEFSYSEGFDEFRSSFPSTGKTWASGAFSVSSSLIAGGR